METIAIVTEIMDTHNAHDKNLVNAINEISNIAEYWHDFRAIIKILADRYADEVYEKVLTDEGDRATDLLERMDAEAFYDACAWEFLTNVCDDQDLATIINYVHYDPDHGYATKFYRAKFNTEDGLKGEILYSADRHGTILQPLAKALLHDLNAYGTKLSVKEIGMETYIRETRAAK